MTDLDHPSITVEVVEEHLDNHSLGSVSPGSNGPGRTRFSQYVPTPHELLRLAEHWVEKLLAIETATFETGESGIDDLRAVLLARCRLRRITEVLGEEAVDEVRSKVEHQFRRRMGDRKWRIFSTGTSEEWQRVVEATYAALAVDPGTPTHVIDYLKKEAIRTFPDLPGETLALALRLAADEIEKGTVSVEPCEHDWRLDRDNYPRGGAIRRFVCAFERCQKCGAMRERNIYPDDPSYEDAIGLAQ